MQRIIIPHVEVDPVLVDPLYPERHQIKGDPYSKTVFSIGRLDDEEQENFSRAFPFEDDDFSSEVQIRPIIERQGDDFIYWLPERFVQFAGAISLMASHEHSAYADAVHKEVKVTVDQQLVPKDSVHRIGHWHSDIGPWVWAHLYSITDCWPTEFECGYQVEPYDLTFSNAGVRHRSPVMPEQATRTFLRMTYTHDLNYA